MVIGICKNCKRKKEYRYKSWVRPFCSYTCKMQFQWLNTKEGAYKPCPQCGKEVYLQPRFFKKDSKYYGDLKFCSRNCFNKYRIGKTYEDLYGNKAQKIKNKLKGRTGWNKGMKMSDEFREKCRVRQIRNMKNPEYRAKVFTEKNMKMLAKTGKARLKQWREENPELHKLNSSKAGKVVHRKFLEKLGVKLNDN